MKKTITCITYFSALLFFIAVSGNKVAAQSQTQEAKDITVGFIKVETVKAIEENLVKALEAERTSGAVTKAMQKFWASAKSLNREELDAFANKWINASRSNLKKITELTPSQLKSYAKDIARRARLDPRVLKQIIYREGDRAGTAILKTLADIEHSLETTGKASQSLLRKLQSEASGLDPQQARAFYDLVKAQSLEEGSAAVKLKTSFFKDNMGTMVEGVFVLSDAFDIYYSDDEPDIKAIKATSKIIDYSVGTGAGAASAALGGGLGPGLVIAFTANRVSTLYTEIAMLEKERAAVKDAEQNLRINNSILVRRQLMKINRMIKSGELGNAEFRLVKLQQFLVEPKHKFDNIEKLLTLRKELEQKARQASYVHTINGIINKARFPFRDALDYYQKNVELPAAKKYAQKALKILNDGALKYPEIKKLKAIPHTKELISLIEARIRKAGALSIKKVEGPERVFTDQLIDYRLFPDGGIPYYRTAGSTSGNVSTDVVTAYWESPGTPGTETVRYDIVDCLGQTAHISKTIEVVARDEQDGNSEAIVRISGNINAKGTMAYFENDVQKSKNDNYDLGNLASFFSFNNDGHYDINGTKYRSTINRSGSRAQAEFIILDIGEVRALELIFDNTQHNRLRGFQWKFSRTETYQDHTDAYSANISVENIPFEKETFSYTDEKSGKDVLGNSYRFKGNITPFLNKCEYSNTITNDDGSFSNRLINTDKEWDIYISVTYLKQYEQ